MFVLIVSLAYLELQKIQRLLARTVPSRLVVLTYHAIPEEEAGRFEDQMRVLKTLATPVFADDFPNGARCAAAVTFDDAFQSVFDQALPIMAKYGIPATVFVPTGFLASAPGWIPPERRQSGTSGVLVSEGRLTSSDSRYVRLGSHTVTHPRLGLLDARALNAELVDSKQALERLTATPVTMLSFPFGSFNTSVLEATRSTGYQHLFANVPLPSNTGNGVRLVGRINVAPRDWPLEFRLKVLGAYSWLALAIPVKRALFGWLGRTPQS